jgi:hypothetical protein
MSQGWLKEKFHDTITINRGPGPGDDTVRFSRRPAYDLDSRSIE